MEKITESRAFRVDGIWHDLHNIHDGVCNSPCGERRKIIAEQEAFVEFVKSIQGEYSICDKCGYEVVCTMSQ